MNIVLQYIFAILAFSIIIIVHELGHFTFAKINRVHVEEFFIGMGPKLLKFKSKSGTLWGLAAIPLGGYNKISGMDREEELPKGKEDKAFYKKPYWPKISIIISGALFNVLFAFLMICIFFGMGVYSPTNKVDYVVQDSPAFTYGIKQNDEVIGINDIDIESWYEFSENIKKFPNEKVVLKVVRDGEVKELEVVLSEQEGSGYLGISPAL